MGQDDFRIAFDPVGVAPSGVEPGGTAHHPANLVQQLAGDLLRDRCTGLGGFDQEQVESGHHLSHWPEPGEPFVIDQRDPTSALYAQLAILAQGAKQTRKSDLAKDKAIELAPKAQRSQVRAQIEASIAQLGGGAGATGAGTPEPTTPGG